MKFVKATKKQSKLRMAIDGPSGSGKTFTSLSLAKALLSGTNKRIRVIDTERGSAAKYSDEFDFDTMEFAPPYSIERYIEAIKLAGSDPATGVLVIDSLSHAWSGEGGALEAVENAKARTRNDFTAWRDVTPVYNRMIDSILAAPCHVIVTMRTKTEYIMEQNDKGRTVPRKIGTKPIQREGMEYEFDVVADMDFDHRAVISKSRCVSISGKVFTKPGRELGETLLTWVSGHSETEVDGGGGVAGDSNKVVPTEQPAGQPFVDKETAILVAIEKASTVKDLEDMKEPMRVEGLNKNDKIVTAWKSKREQLKGVAA